MGAMKGVDEGAARCRCRECTVSTGKKDNTLYSAWRPSNHFSDANNGGRFGRLDEFHVLSTKRPAVSILTSKTSKTSRRTFSKGLPTDSNSLTR